MPTKHTSKRTAEYKKIAAIVFSKISGLLVFFVVYFTYLLTMYPTVQTEDSGELITSALLPDIAHPPGYPLYTILGKIFSYLVPFGNPAWRINIMSALFGALTAQLIYLIIKKKGKNEIIAFGGAIFYAFTSIVWSQSNRAEVYTLNTFALALVIYLLLRWNEEKKNLWLLLTALVFGIGVGDHHLLLLALPAMGLYVLIKNWKVIINPKIVFGCLGLLALGLSVYAYLPIRTYVAPYNNPAFIEHNGLYTWDSFISFVNRKIYGGTVNVPTDEATQEAAVEHLPAWVLDIKDFFTSYGTRFLNGNGNGLVPLLKIITREYLYIPLFFFLPGLYYLFKKDPKWGAFILMLFLCYTTILLIFTPIDADMNDYATFSTEPFMMPSIMVLGIIISQGFVWLHDSFTNKELATWFSIVCLVPGAVTLGKNFVPNNESRNFVAYDFNKLALESLPPGGYLISTGRDNMTFPLYYLREIEHVRPDVQVEIYYSTSPVSQDFLQNRVDKNGGKPVFIDLLPPNYINMGLHPYNFVYEYGGNPSIPAPTMQNPVVRGIRGDMDLPNTRLKLLYYIKASIMAKDPAVRKSNFEQVYNAKGDNSYYINIIGDYAYYTNDFDTAREAYEKSNNDYGLQKIEDALNNPGHVEDESLQTGMY